MEQGVFRLSGRAVSCGVLAPPLGGEATLSRALRQPATLADTALVTLFARTLAPLLEARMLSARRVATATAVSAAAALLFSAAPAHAFVTEVEGTKLGLQRTNEISYLDGLGGEVFNTTTSKLEAIGNSKAETFSNPAGHPVLHGANVFAVYWDPKDYYHGDWQNVVDTFLQSMGAESGSLASVFSVDTQYTDVSNEPAYYKSTFRGAYTDTHPYPSHGCPVATGAVNCLTPVQLQEQLKEFIAAQGLPKGMGTVYYLLTPPHLTVCLDSAGTECSEFSRTETEEEQDKYESESYRHAFCSYHADINPGGLATGDGNTIIYAAIPWSAGEAGQSLLATIRRQAPGCDDGGFNPSSKPPEEREKVKARNAQEEREFNEKTPEEQEKVELEKTLQGPHDQEPNQVPCPSPDGTCDTGLADLIVNQIALEQQNIVTDPLLNAWQDEEGKEATDECRNYFARASVGGGASANPESGGGTLYNQTLSGHNYYLNMAFNLAALRLPYPGIPCIPADRLEPQFTSPNPVNNGEVVGFDGMESDISLNAAIAYSGGFAVPNYATYTWSFGDGSQPVSGYAPGAPACESPWLSPCAASVFHSYQYGGTYAVTLTVTDVGGHSATVTHDVTVNGPAAPTSGSSTSPGTTSGSSTSSAGGSQPGASSTAASSSHPSVVPAPVAAAAVMSRSLRGTLRKGLSIRYSVNEQVTGHFEVLLSRTLAHHLRISGSAASGLPAGTPPQIVIAKAILVTTTAGRSTITIQFSKQTAARLAKERKVTLLLRLIVRNARGAATTTVLSSFTLSG